MPAYTVSIDRWQDTLWAEIKIGDSTYTYAPWTEDGWTAQWVRDGQVIPNAIGPTYNIARPADENKTIKVRVAGHGHPALESTNGILISEAPYVPPAVTINYQNFSGLTGERFDKILREVDEAYRDDIADCKTTILATGKPLTIEFYYDETERGATIKNGKLNIKFSCEYYESFDQTDRAERLDQIGAELRNLTLDAETIGLEYSGNYEDIHMAKLTKPQPVIGVTILL